MNDERRWSAQVNDLIGGWVVTDYPHPMSFHDNRNDGDPTKNGYIIADCMTEEDATRIAALLNAMGPTPEQRRRETKFLAND